MLETARTLASYIFFHAMRSAIRALGLLDARLNSGRPIEWRLLTAEMLKQPLVLPAIMTNGPRWNPHAIVLTAGPCSVKQTLSVDVEALLVAAKTWTLVIYSFPRLRAVAHVGALQAPFEARWQTIALAPGRYSLGLRLYDSAAAVTLPEVRADGRVAVARKEISPARNDVYGDLKQRRGWLYFLLHYYVYNLLRGSVTIPGISAEREFLPVGNPETEFRYGALARGEALRMKLPDAVLASHHVYFTLYSRDSFPVLWYEVHESPHLTAAASEDGFYLMRLHARKAEVSAPVADSVVIETLKPGEHDAATGAFWPANS